MLTCGSFLYKSPCDNTAPTWMIQGNFLISRSFSGLFFCGCAMQHVGPSTPTRDWTLTPRNGSVDSQPLYCQGSPSRSLIESTCKGSCTICSDTVTGSQVRSRPLWGAIVLFMISYYENRFINKKEGSTDKTSKSMNLENSMLLKETSHKNPHLIWSYLHKTLRIGKCI